MPDLEAHGIEIVSTPDGVGYELPPRQLGKAKWIGLFLVIFGAVFAGLPGGGVLSSFFGSSGPSFTGFGWVLPLIFALFVLPFIFIGISIFLIGLAVILGGGRCSVTITHDRLSTTDRIGPFWLTRSRPLEGLAKLTISHDAVQFNGKPIKEGPAADVGDVKAEFEGDTRHFHFALLYPKLMLIDLANTIAQRTDSQVTGKLFTDDKSRPTVTVVDESSEDVVDTTIPDRPSDGVIEMDERTDGTTFRIPPQGYLAGSSGLGCFSILWNGFLVVFTTAMVWGIGRGNLSTLVIPLVIISIFWAVGIGLVIGALNMGRRRAIIDVVGTDPGNNFLLISQSNLFGSKQHEFAAADIEALYAGPSGMEVNDRPVYNLQVHPYEGKVIGILSGIDDKELLWLAALLRHKLAIPLTRQQQQHAEKIDKDSGEDERDELLK